MSDFDFSIREISITKTTELKQAVLDLFAGKLLGLAIPSFIAPKQCNQIVQKIYASGIEWFEEGTLGRIGVSIPDQKARHGNMKDYFSKISQYLEQREIIFSKTGDPTTKMLQQVFALAFENCGVAYDSNMQSFYSPGVLELQRNGRLIHVDNIIAESQKRVGQPTNELSTALYLQAPNSGGELKLFEKVYEDCDEPLRLPVDSIANRGFSDQVCQGCRTIFHPPKTGELVIFANCYYHQVLSSQGEKLRITQLCTTYLVDNKTVVAYV